MIFTLFKSTFRLLQLCFIQVKEISRALSLCIMKFFDLSITCLSVFLNWSKEDKFHVSGSNIFHSLKVEGK